MIFNVSLGQLFRIAKDGSSTLHYIESEDTILLLRAIEGFTYKSEYTKTKDENDLLFKESYLKDAIQVDGATDENPLTLSVLQNIQELIDDVDTKLAYIEENTRGEV